MGVLQSRFRVAVRTADVSKEMAKIRSPKIPTDIEQRNSVSRSETRQQWQNDVDSGSNNVAEKDGVTLTMRDT